MPHEHDKRQMEARIRHLFREFVLEQRPLLTRWVFARGLEAQYSQRHELGASYPDFLELSPGNHDILGTSHALHTSHDL